MGYPQRVEVAWNKGLWKIIIESDFASIVNILKMGTTGVGSNKFFKRIKQWQQRDWEVEYSHVLRKGNSCADWLTNWSLSHEMGFHWIESPSGELASLVFRDFSGVSVP